MLRIAASLLASAASLLNIGCHRTPLTTAALFSDGMVLQRNTTAPIWGRCEPGQQIRVRASWLRDELTTVTDLHGVWVIQLPTTDAGGPHRLEVRGSGELVIDDVWLGEVWLCAGGADMDWRVAPGPNGGGVENAAEEIARATDPRIRHFEVEDSIAVYAQAECAGAWSVSSPQTVGAFSATGYFFARELLRELDVPIGIVNVTWVGARAQSWMGEFHVKANGLSIPQAEEIEALRASGFDLNEEQRLGRDPGFTPSAPTLVFNAMVVPLAPCALRGVLWREGESDRDRCNPYFQYQRTLINSWRDVWCAPRLPFYFVQLPPRVYAGDVGESAALRDGQRRALELPNTGMAVVSDLGLVDEARPRKEQEVGRRLAAWALAKDYGFVERLPSGPLLRSAQLEGARVRLAFDYADGLRANSERLLGFELAAEDNRFVVAEATLEGEGVVLSHPSISAPRTVRYAYTSVERANLVNAAGLPAASFRIALEPAK